MITIIAIILADVFVFLLFVYQYRQELSLTVNGSHDLPVVRVKPPKEPAAPAGVAGGQGGRGQQVAARP
jgi:alkanesulfonate monooxygenase SsuD/methylene tetrahydromethanopterin reductase-like flavin-dependent oxidoreductase (luciferase family)